MFARTDKSPPNCSPSGSCRILKTLYCTPPPMMTKNQGRLFVFLHAGHLVLAGSRPTNTPALILPDSFQHSTGQVRQACTESSSYSCCVYSQATHDESWPHSHWCCVHVTPRIGQIPLTVSRWLAHTWMSGLSRSSGMDSMGMEFGEAHVGRPGPVRGGGKGPLQLLILLSFTVTAHTGAQPHYRLH